MPQFAANLTMMFTEVPFMDRFGRAAAAGFKAVEYLFPYAHPADEIAAALRKYGLTQALFNLPPGNWEAGDRGMAGHPGREAEFRQSVETALDYARVIGCRTLHCMAGITARGIDREEAWASYIANVRHAAAAAAPLGITVVLEPINGRDMPGYLLSTTTDARRVIETVGAENLGLQLDLYHCQISEGDLAMRIKDLATVTKHMQIAGVPERHEPDTGEVNYPYLFEIIDGTGYAGFVGCEYRPRGKTEDGLGWFHRAIGAGAAA